MKRMAQFILYWNRGPKFLLIFFATKSQTSKIPASKLSLPALSFIHHISVLTYKLKCDIFLCVSVGSDLSLSLKFHDKCCCIFLQIYARVRNFVYNAKETDDTLNNQVFRWKSIIIVTTRNQCIFPFYWTRMVWEPNITKGYRKLNTYTHPYRDVC